MRWRRHAPRRANGSSRWSVSMGRSRVGAVAKPTLRLAGSLPTKSMCAKTAYWHEPKWYPAGLGRCQFAHAWAEVCLPREGWVSISPIHSSAARDPKLLTAGRKPRRFWCGDHAGLPRVRHVSADLCAKPTTSSIQAASALVTRADRSNVLRRSRSALLRKRPPNAFGIVQSIMRA